MRGKFEVMSSIEGGMNSSVCSAAGSVAAVVVETLEAVEAHRTACSPSFNWDVHGGERQMDLSLGEISRCWRVKKSEGRDEAY